MEFSRLYAALASRSRIFPGLTIFYCWSLPRYYSQSCRNPEHCHQTTSLKNLIFKRRNVTKLLLYIISVSKFFYERQTCAHFSCSIEIIVNSWPVMLYSGVVSRHFSLPPPSSQLDAFIVTMVTSRPISSSAHRATSVKALRLVV